ncbi:MAG: protein kinase [Phycisphaeraceae bacterium]|nr:protein kinase [Phycisphaeraceae bacterium]
MPQAMTGQPAHVGEKIGSYELLSRLDESASIVTFQGRDPLLDRRVIVRQVLAAAGEEGQAFMARCRQRIEKFRQLTSRQRRVADLIEVIEDPRGLFVVLEQVEGKTLQDQLADGKPIAALSVLRVLRSAAMALEPLHAAGLPHLDLRPANMTISSSGAVRLTDFGLAAEREMMKPAAVRYMSPELCRGEEGHAGSDLYSLGMIAYEMLLGRAEFEQEFSSVLRDPRHEALRWVKWHTNLRSSAAPAHELNPRIAPLLGQLVARMMEKDPAKRLNSTRQLIDAIERHFSREQPTRPQAASEKQPAPTAHTTSGGGGGGGDTAKLPQRKRFVWPMILLAAIVVLCASAGGLYLHFMKQQADVSAHLENARSRLDEAERLHLSGEFDQALVLYEQVAAEYPPEQRLGEVARAGAMLCQVRLKTDEGAYDDAAALLDQVAGMGVFRGDTIRDLRQEIEHRRDVQQNFQQIRSSLSEARLDAADMQIRRMRSVLLSDAQRQTLDELGAELAGLRAQQQVDQTLTMVDQMLSTGRRDEAITLIQSASNRYEPRLQQRLDELERQRRLDAVLAKAEQAESAGEWSAAIAAYHEALNISDAQPLVERLSQARMNAALADGRRLYEQGDTAGAASSFRQAQAFGDSDEARGYLSRLKSADDRRVFEKAGDELFAQSEFAAAARQYAEALALTPDGDGTLSAKHNDARVRALMAEGHRWMRQGDFDQARTAFQQAWNVDAGSAASEALTELDKRSKQAQLLAEGDKLRAAAKFGPAKLVYLKARDVLDDPEVRQRLDDVEYEHLLAQARSYLDALRPEAAVALLQSAQKIHDTPQVQQLLLEARKGAGNE